MRESKRWGRGLWLGALALGMLAFGAPEAVAGPRKAVPPSSQPRRAVPPGPRLGKAPARGGATAAARGAGAQEGPHAGALRSLWTTQVGKTTFRSTIWPARGGFLVLGSGGADARSDKDPADGLAVIQAATGKKVRLLQAGGQGDRDVNGVAVMGGDVVFGTDSQLLVRGDVAGRVHWEVQLDGDIEGAPALGDLTRDGRPDVVVGTEAGTVWALEGLTGRILWQVATGRGEYDQQGILGSAALADLDGDGRDDVVIGARDGRLRALSGADGRALWEVAGKSGIHASPWLQDVNSDGSLEVLWAESYGEVWLLAGKDGRTIWRHSLEHAGGGIEGLFASPVFLSPLGDGGCAVVGTSWWGEGEGIYCVGAQGVQWRFETGARVSSSAAVGDLLGLGRAQVVVGVEDGRVVLLDQDGSLLLSLRLAGPVEATPALLDLDGDQRLDLVVATRDGSVSAFAGKGRAPAWVEGFRGGPENRGQGRPDSPMGKPDTKKANDAPVRSGGPR